jgi:DNA-binding beta-propeller fold protein YncE
MKVLRATKSVLGMCLLVRLALGVGFAQPLPNPPVAAPTVTAVSQRLEVIHQTRAFPAIQLWGNEMLTYLGMFSPDATFRTVSRFKYANGYSPGEDISPAPAFGHTAQPGGAPVSMLLPNERVVESLEPPAKAVAIAHGHTRAAETRNRFVTYAYGRPSVLHSPQHVATDSHQRLIISDPEGGAVHVLDRAGRTSFRIVSGEGRRLHQPAGVAVDADDNIYVADSDRGMLVVFDRNGGFVRYIGNYDGENEYVSPHGIAIDRKAARLYLVDSPRNLVFVLDLAGKVLGRYGKYRGSTGVGTFNHPTDVAFHHGHISVLDNWGTRVQVIDSASNVVGGFELPHSYRLEDGAGNGLGVDEQGNVYVSSNSASVITVYSQDGQCLASFGQMGRRVGEFAGPNGLWIDSGNRMYVADSGNGRVQMFQLTAVP